MDGSLDDIRFLADSQHRPVVLQLLAERPRSRTALQDATGASSATIGRIASSFEARGWLKREGSTYRLTRLGEFVATAFDALHRDMSVARELHELLPGVPIDAIGVDVDAFSDATVTRVTPINPFAIVTRVRELELESSNARSLTDFFPEPCIDGRHEAIVNGTQSFEAVFAPVVIESAMTSPAADKFRAIVTAERTSIYVTDAAIRLPVMVHDGVGCLVVRDADNVSIGMIETEHPTVLEWVTAEFEAYREAATLLSPGDLDDAAIDFAERASVD